MAPDALARDGRREPLADGVRGRAGVPDAGRAAGRRAAGLRDRLRAVGGHARRHARARRAAACTCWPRRRPRPTSTACARCGPTWARAGLVQVAEQYLLMPAHAARLAVVRDGAIGEPTSVQVSSTHLYHAVSMIRGLLGVGFEPATVTARALHRAAGRPVSFDGWHGDVEPRPKQTTLATLDFGGRHGPLRLHRQPVVEPAAGAADRRARHDRRARRRRARAARRRAHRGRVAPDPARHRHRPQPRGLRPRPHQPRRARASGATRSSARASPRTISASRCCSSGSARGRAAKARSRTRWPRACRITC